MLPRLVRIVVVGILACPLGHALATGLSRARGEISAQAAAMDEPLPPSMEGMRRLYRTFESPES